MRGVASVAMALAMAATLSVGVSAAPAKIVIDGRVHTHFHSGQTSFIDGELFRHLPRFEIDWRWPPFGLSRSGKLAAGGPDQAHIEQHNFLYLSGSDVWRHWAFAHAGAVWSPAGLDNEGFALKLLLNGGVYRYLSGALNNTTVIGRQYSITVLPGWRFKFGNSIVTVYGGFDLQQFRTYPEDPDAKLRGRYFGMRGTVELWHEPSPSTMLAADLSMSSIGGGNYARLAYGWRLFDRFYLGPELQAYMTDQYQHARAGLHVTAFKTEDREWSGAVGYATDNDHRSGFYIRIGTLIRK
jgi:hypothetical protein